MSVAKFTYVRARMQPRMWSEPHWDWHGVWKCAHRSPWRQFVSSDHANHVRSISWAVSWCQWSYLNHVEKLVFDFLCRKWWQWSAHNEWDSGNNFQKGWGKAANLPESSSKLVLFHRFPWSSPLVTFFPSLITSLENNYYEYSFRKF